MNKLSADQIEALRELREFGKVDLLCNIHQYAVFGALSDRGLCRMVKENGLSVAYSTTAGIRALTRDALTPHDVQRVKPKPAKRPAWCVSLGNGRISRRMTKRHATKLAARFNRLFRTDVAYVTS